MKAYIDFLNESIEIEKEWNSIMLESFKFEKEIFNENTNIYLNEASRQSLKDSIIKNKNNTIEKARENVLKVAESIKRYANKVKNSSVLKKVEVLIAKLKTVKDIKIIKSIRSKLNDIRKSIKK